MDQDNLAISFKKVTKKFFLQDERTFKEFLPQLLMGKPPGREFTVFSNLSFDIKTGETVGIVGRNGSGKSTILRLIAGVTSPTSGKIIVNGKVAPLIDIGAGFHHELTGYENIFLNGAILGLHKKEIEQVLDSIIEFSELKEFIHTPVKKYSTGMYMKLGFSIAIHANSPIILIDEVLAVGDLAFQEKCLTVLNAIKKNQGRTIVFVSHDDHAVKKFCDRVILLNQGEIVADDTPENALKLYHKLLHLNEQ